MARIFQLGIGIHVGHNALAVTGTAHIDAKTGISVRGEKRVVAFVAGTHHVALAVGNIFENRRHGTDAIRQPETRRKTHAVRHLDPAMLDLGHWINRPLRRHHGPTPLRPVLLNHRHFPSEWSSWRNFRQ